LPSTRAGTERRARGERAGAHAEARAERRRNVAEEIAAAGAAAVIGNGSGDISAKPMPAGFTLRIDALHREAGQVLHFLSLRKTLMKGWPYLSFQDDEGDTKSAFFLALSQKADSSLRSE